MQHAEKKKKNKNTTKFFSCPHPECGKSFRTKFSMTRHTLSHSQEKRFECPQCNKKFALEHNMKEHINTHTHDKPFVCGVDGCQERFRQSGKLSLHRRTHPGFSLKEYIPNSNFNKMLKEEGKGKLDVVQENSKEGKIIQPETIVPIKDSERNLLRQESGQTNVSVTGKIERVLQRSQSDRQKGLLTMEALEQHNILMESIKPSSIYKFYLDMLSDPISQSLRPVLPIPEQVKIENPHHEPCAKLDLFELLEKQNKST